MMGGADNCTVGALRSRAAEVDTTEVSMPAHHPTEGSGRGGRVTSGDVQVLFRQVRGKHAAGSGVKPEAVAAE